MKLFDKKQLLSLLKSSNNPNKKAKSEQIKTALVLVGVVAAGYGYYLYSTKPKEHHKEVKHHLSGVFDENFGQNYDHSSLRTLNDKLDQQAAQIEKLQNKKYKQASSTDHLDAVTEKRLQGMQSEIKQLKEQLIHAAQKPVVSKTVTPKVNHDAAFQPAASRLASYQTLQHPKPSLPMINTVGIDDVSIQYPEQKEKAEARTAKNYVWAGTFATGYLMTGIIGDAGFNSTNNKGTVAIRLTTRGKMPNGKISHLKDCVVLGSSYGDLSSDSDVIHLETLSCAGKKYSFEKKVYGSVFDLDAMQDLRGIPVLKASPILGYAGLAGLLAGVGQGVSQSGSTTTVTGAGVVQTPTSVGRSALGGGAQQAGNKIGEYLMKIANIYHPIVVAHAGRRVTVLFQAGFWIDKKHSHFESMKSIGDGKLSKSVPHFAQSVVTNAQVLTKDKTVKPDQLTQEVVAASGKLNQPLAQLQAQNEFNENKLRLGQSLFKQVQARS